MNPISREELEKLILKTLIYRSAYGNEHKPDTVKKISSLDLTKAQSTVKNLEKLESYAREFTDKLFPNITYYINTIPNEKAVIGFLSTSLYLNSKSISEDNRMSTAGNFHIDYSKDGNIRVVNSQGKVGKEPLSSNSNQLPTDDELIRALYSASVRAGVYAYNLEKQDVTISELRIPHGSNIPKFGVLDLSTATKKDIEKYLPNFREYMTKNGGNLGNQDIYTVKATDFLVSKVDNWLLGVSRPSMGGDTLFETLGDKVNQDIKNKIRKDITIKPKATEKDQNIKALTKRR